MTDTQETIADIRKDAEAKFRELVESYMQRRAAFQTTVGAMQAFNTVFDRLEAAHKRERGDAAKLREAVGYILKYADSVACRDHDEHTRHYIDQIRKWAQSALAEPPRNCDKYATADEALKAQEQMFNDSNFANGECKLGCPECDNPRVGCKIAWLFATATEKEGGNDAD